MIGRAAWNLQVRRASIRKMARRFGGAVTGSFTNPTLSVPGVGGITIRLGFLKMGGESWPQGKLTEVTTSVDLDIRTTFAFFPAIIAKGNVCIPSKFLTGEYLARSTRDRNGPEVDFDVSPIPDYVVYSNRPDFAREVTQKVAANITAVRPYTWELAQKHGEPHVLNAIFSSWKLTYDEAEPLVEAVQSFISALK